jgi:hypothetical protein
MLILVQFPLVDARRFLADPTGRLDRPTWPTALPFPDKPHKRASVAATAAPAANPAHPPLEHSDAAVEYDFIRSFGVVRRRKLGPITGWTGESLFCDLKNLVRFHRAPPEVAFRDTNGWRLKIRGAHRRFFTDGRAMGRFEVGFRLSWAAPAGVELNVGPVVPPEGVAQIARFVMEAPMSIADHYTARAFEGTKKRPGRHEVMLADLAPFLAHAYLHASAKESAGHAKPLDDSWWVKVGNPVMFVSFGQKELERLPVSANVLAMRRGAPAPAATAPAEVELGDDRPVISLDEHALTRDRATRVWYIRQGSGTPASRDAARRARIHLMRFASESDGVTRIIRLIQLKKIPLVRSKNDSDPSGLLQLYLQDAIGFLQRKVQDDMQNDTLFSSLIASAESLPLTDVASLLQAVTEARANVRKQIENFVNNYYEGDHVEGNKNEINASQGGVVSGVNQVNAGGDVTATASGQVTQMSAQMKKLFDNLQEEVDKATATASPADKAAVQEKVDKFQADVKKGKENRKWYDVSAKGLLDAVAAVGGIVAPIGAVVAKIVALVA